MTIEKKRLFCNPVETTKRLLESEFAVFDTTSLRAIIPVESDRTFFSIVKKLVESGILLRLEKNKYLVKRGDNNSFDTAARLYIPSYISFETALNFHGVLSQFPYEITSATSRKTAVKKWDGVLYSYTHIKPDLFFGYIRKGGALIAEPEKALLDQMYLAAKGFKKLALDEYDLSCLKKTKLKNYGLKFPETRQTRKMPALLERVLELC